jgi:MOSC domain-containing protein YiiM
LQTGITSKERHTQQQDKKKMENIRRTSAVALGVAFLAISLSSNSYSSFTGAFNSYIPRIQSDLSTMVQNHKSSHLHPQPQTQTQTQAAFIHNRSGQNIMRPQIHSQEMYNRQSLILHSWLRTTLESLGLDWVTEKLNYQPPPQPNSNHDDSSNSKSNHGTVIRTATKSYHATHSLPSSNEYTTAKSSRGEISVTQAGVKEDYNHYRTTALSSTPDRAISILTTDVMKMVRNAGWNIVKDGDLGENVYIDGIDYTYFEIGKRYQFQDGSKKKESNSNMDMDVDVEGVMIEITERIEPCGNLCKLPYINDESLEPRERFENCKKFLLWLDEKDGLRGWYAKIVNGGGRIKLGDSIAAVSEKVSGVGGAGATGTVGMGAMAV